MPDKYDLAIEYLVENPEEASDLWSCGADSETPLSPLFQYCTPSGKSDDGTGECGCLTQIRGDRSGETPAWTEELTKAILEDERLHYNEEALQRELERSSKKRRRELLQPYAEWQRKLDKEIRGVNEN